jgi:hypothetical protein
VDVAHPFHLLILVATLTLSACGWVFDGEPDGLKRGREATKTSAGVCPQIDGAYRNTGSDLAAVVTRLARTGMALGDWETVVISGHPDVAVQFIFARTSDTRDTVTIERDRGYDCHTGWLHPDGAAGLLDEIKARGRSSPNEEVRDDRTHRYEFYLTSNRRGQLAMAARASRSLGRSGAT